MFREGTEGSVEGPNDVMILTAVIWALSLCPAIAHDWYPASCCSDHDCRELVEDKGEVVSETPKGWLLWDGRLVSRGTAKLSPNGKFHLCETATKSIICFYAPPGAS
jgi:hypothetical protein